MNRIKELREERGLSLKDLQDQIQSNKGIKIGRASLNNYEREEQVPKQETWEVLADFFNVTVPYIMGLSPARNKAENMFYEQSISGLVDLVEENGSTTSDLRKNISSFFHLLRNNKDDSAALKQIRTILNTLSILSSKSSDTFIFDSNGDYLSNPQILNMVLEKKKDIENSTDFFVQMSIDQLPDYSQIVIDPRELFGSDVKIPDILNDVDDNYSFEEFLKDEKKKEEFRKKMNEKLEDNFKKIKRDRNTDI